MSIKGKIGMALATTALGAALIGGGTFAIFTSSATNTNNSFTAGTLNISLDKPDGTKYFDITSIAPGDSGSSAVTVTNTGTLGLRYTINNVLSGDLATSVDENNDGTLDGNQLVVKAYSDAALTQEITGARPLETGSETIYVKWSLPKAAGNWYQGKNAKLALTVNAEQTRNN